MKNNLSLRYLSFLNYNNLHISSQYLRQNLRFQNKITIFAHELWQKEKQNLLKPYNYETEQWNNGGAY